MFILLLTGCLAVLALPGAAMAHGASGDGEMAHMAGCPDCPDAANVGDGQGSDASHDCPHLTGCAAMVLMETTNVLPLRAAPQPRFRLPGSWRIAGMPMPTDLPPPRG
ncbi:hypothetical protein KUV62_00425 [Salipiger bermudensis]|uniref:hypothetical protein n=1 Tax=Salipiger bermudensis TaxID=344736 RepID=UPI001C9A29A6|nr:hypothetical protein [Salipiger bermudensis]MBY6002353.1 hypothetical protein [Salipiger bermudensis]